MTFYVISSTSLCDVVRHPMGATVGMISHEVTVPTCLVYHAYTIEKAKKLKGKNLKWRI